MSCTIEDIARELNLSASTISRSLKQNARIHPTTRAKVAEAAARLGYQGRSRRITTHATTQNYRVAVLLSSALHKDSPNTMRELQGIQSQADDMGIHLDVDYALENRHKSDDASSRKRKQSILDRLAKERYHAALLLGRHDPAFVIALRQQFCPVISLNWEYPGVEMDLVTSTNVTGYALATRKLIDLGHNRMTYVDECYPATFHTQRHAGFIQACMFGGLNPNDQILFDAEGYDEHGDLLDVAVDILLQNGSTAYACANDRVAYLICQALEKRNIRIPDQISVIGYDGMQPLRPTNIRLSTMAQDFMELGRACMSLAHRRITQPSSSTWTVSIDGYWFAGQSIAPPCR